MGFEQFEREKGGKGGTGPRISMRKSGSIGINGKAMEQYFGKEDYITLYFDKDADRVGIKPEPRSKKNTYKLQKRSESGHGGSISATSFMREYDLLPNKTKQYRAEWDEENGMIVADTSNPILTYDN